MGELIAKVDPTWWSEVSAGIFLVGFIALVCWLYWPGNRTRYSTAERLPIED